MYFDDRQILLLVEFCEKLSTSFFFLVHILGRKFTVSFLHKSIQKFGLMKKFEVSGKILIIDLSTLLILPYKEKKKTIIVTWKYFLAGAFFFSVYLENLEY